MKIASMTLLASFLLLAAACSGGGKDGGGETAAAEIVDPGSGLSASFTSAQPNPGSKTVSLAPGGTAGDAVTVGVKVTDTGDVHTAAFDLVFDPDAVRYVGYSAGSLLEQGGNTPVYQVSSQTGRVVVGISRSGSTGANAVGSPLSISMIFEVMEAGSHNVTMENTSLLDSNLAVISGMSWFGGTAVAN